MHNFLWVFTDHFLFDMTWAPSYNMKAVLSPRCNMHMNIWMVEGFICIKIRRVTVRRKNSTWSFNFFCSLLDWCKLLEADMMMAAMTRELQCQNFIRLIFLFLLKEKAWHAFLVQIQHVSCLNWLEYDMCTHMYESCVKQASKIFLHKFWLVRTWVTDSWQVKLKSVQGTLHRSGILGRTSIGSPQFFFPIHYFRDVDRIASQGRECTNHVVCGHSSDNLLFHLWNS